MANENLLPITRLRGLLEVSRLVRRGDDLHELLGAIAATISETLGFRTVAINLYRPAWDDFSVAVVHGNERARDTLLGTSRDREDWEPVLVPRYLRRGAYFLPREEVDWEDTHLSYVPDLPPSDDPNAWHADDALFVLMRDSDHGILGIVSVDEPLSGSRPTDDELDVLVSVADHAAIAVQGAQEAAQAQRHRRALEELLAVSTRLAETSTVDVILAAVCSGIRDALGFENVSIELADPRNGRLETKAAVGWSEGDPALAAVMTLADVQPLLEPRFEVAGCYLLSAADAGSRVAPEHQVYTSRSNGRGPNGWQDHWLFVPLYDREGALFGVIWVDEPVDRLLPSRERLQALRVFANQATAALFSAEQFSELRFLADHDPLTRLLNRRAFIRRLEAEVARSARYGRSFSLVVCDLDGFKQLNDRHGHPAGDEALSELGAILGDALRRPDDAFRIGGDEFALLLAEAAEDDAREVVERIGAAIGTSRDERLAAVKMRFGVASCPEHANDPQTLFRLADEALYAAKRGGRPVEFAA
ncbi:MAG TPA: sensor domain-containing diguanylate cyclase [Gaiellaceae bacterium]